MLMSHPNSVFAAMCNAANAVSGSADNSQLPAAPTDGTDAAPASNGSADEK